MKLDTIFSKSPACHTFLLFLVFQFISHEVGSSNLSTRRTSWLWFFAIFPSSVQSHLAARKLIPMTVEPAWTNSHVSQGTSVYRDRAQSHSPLWSCICNPNRLGRLPKFSWCWDEVCLSLLILIFWSVFLMQFNVLIFQLSRTFLCFFLSSVSFYRIGKLKAGNCNHSVHPQLFWYVSFSISMVLLEPSEGSDDKVLFNSIERTALTSIVMDVMVYQFEFRGS